MADDSNSEIEELRARLAALEGQKGAPPPAASPPKLSTKNGCMALLLTIVLVAVLVSMCSDPDKPASDGASLPPVAAGWAPPEGYTLHAAGRGGLVGYQWSKTKGSECRGSNTTCWAMNVVTQNACPRSLYASITLLDKSGNNIGWTNDTAQGVEPGEVTRLVFSTYENGADTARVAELNCY